MNAKKIIGISVAGAFLVGMFFIGRKIWRDRRGVIPANGGGNSGGGNPPATQNSAKISQSQASTIAQGLQNLMNDCPYSTDSVAEFKKIAGAITNQADWDLLKTTYGSRTIDSCGFNMTQWGDHTGDLSSSITWDYSASEVSEIRNWLSSKGINAGL
jgi:hypothetical protein